MSEIAVWSIDYYQEGSKGLDEVIKIYHEEEKAADLLNMNMFEVLGSKRDYASFLLFCAQSVHPHSGVYNDKAPHWCQKESIEKWITSDDEQALCWIIQILQNSVTRWNTE